MFVCTAGQRKTHLEIKSFSGGAPSPPCVGGARLFFFFVPFPEPIPPLFISSMPPTISNRKCGLLLSIHFTFSFLLKNKLGTPLANHRSRNSKKKNRRARVIYVKYLSASELLMTALSRVYIVQRHKRTCLGSHSISLKLKRMRMCTKSI